MSIRLENIEPEPHKAFEKCKLGREKYADILTNIVNAYPSGFVMAVNNKWGTGKTTFVKMWIQKLKDTEYQTVYFNAWENDFEDNPLTALMGELKTLISDVHQKEFKSLLEKGAILSKNIAPAIVKALIKKYTGVEEFEELLGKTTEGITEIFENEVNDYSKKKRSITDFRNKLSDFVTTMNKGKPLIFVVDELDRCRPNYAVSILEQIKHFFSVSGIVFVLSIDKEQLGNAVRGVYGSDRIDADEYLKRFIDIEYSLPEPKGDEFYQYLYEYFNFKEFFLSDDRRRYFSPIEERESFDNVCRLLFVNKPIPLRQQEKIFAQSRLSLRTFSYKNFVVPFVFIYLNYIKVLHLDLYNSIKNKKLDIKEFQSEYKKIIIVNFNEKSKNIITALEAYLLFYYVKYLDSDMYHLMIYKQDNNSNEKHLAIESIINNDDDLSNFGVIFDKLMKGWNEAELDMGYFFKKIDLMENIKF